MNSVKEKTLQKLQSTLKALPADQQNLIASIEDQLKAAIEAQIALVIAEQKQQFQTEKKPEKLEKSLKEEARQSTL